MDNQDGQVDQRILNAKTHLEMSLDFLTRVIQTKNDQETSVVKAERTLGKASKIIYDLAWFVDNQNDHSDRSWSRKKRYASVSILDTSVTSEVQEAQSDHGESGASLSPEKVRFTVQEYLKCLLFWSSLFHEIEGG